MHHHNSAAAADFHPARRSVRGLDDKTSAVKFFGSWTTLSAAASSPAAAAATKKWETNCCSCSQNCASTRKREEVNINLILFFSYFSWKALEEQTSSALTFSRGKSERKDAKFFLLSSEEKIDFPFQQLFGFINGQYLCVLPSTHAKLCMHACIRRRPEIYLAALK